MATDWDLRSSKAYDAMKILGIDEGRVKPVLKRLLKLFNGSWILIEAENYRALADAIFEDAHHKQTNEESVDPINNDAEPPSKKSHRRLQKVTSSKNNGIKILEPGESEILKSSNRTRLVKSSLSSSGDSRDKSHHHLQQLSVQNKGLPRQEAIHCKSGNLNPSKKRQHINCSPQFSLPASNLGLDKREKNGGSGSRHAYAGTTFQMSRNIASSNDRSVINNLPVHDQTSCPKRENLIIECEARDEEKKVASHSRSAHPVALVAQRQPINNSNGEYAIRRISDITNGTEKVSISLVDEIGVENLPKFRYVSENTVYQSAFVHASLARIADEDCCSRCTGDCLLSSVPCACARDTRGKFAYTREGLLTEEFLGSCISMKLQPQDHYQFFCEDYSCPLEKAKNASRPEKCKGHLERKFIKECWRKCGCNMKCGNRVVQRGITRKLQVCLTNRSKGWGLRTLEELPKGAFVCEYAGEILTNIELYERNKKSTGKYKHTYPVLLDADWCSENVLNDENALCLDAKYYGNVARFINHRCFDSNLLDIPVQVETPDRHYYHIAFFTKRKVDAYEELTWDYGIDFDDHNHPIKAFRCSCGSEFCRDKGSKKGNCPISSSR